MRRPGPFSKRVAAALAVAAALILAPVVARRLPASPLPSAPRTPVSAETPVPDRASAKARRLAEAAMWQAGRTVRYDAGYAEIRYPGGDVPLERGVCTDVVVRAFRRMGIDLQVEVHEDMARAFAAYPKRWGLSRPDPNIDHRRVPNLQTYFERRGEALRVTREAGDYQPGDIVTWDVAGRPHVGIVSTRRDASGARFLIAHNIGSGVRITDDLFTFPVTGHYRPF